MGFYAVTLFVSALLLFTLQPMAAKTLLPLLGGAPSVWNTCLVFFQSVLLLGYAYAHWLSTRLAPRRQAIAHVLMLALPLLALPIRRPGGWMPPAEGDPVIWLLGLLCAMVGLPFFVVSTSAPLFQRWFSRSGHADAADPYFLYAASNAGSLLALLAYPTLIEPWLSLTAQRHVWALGYAVFAVLGCWCAWRLWRQAGTTSAQPSTAAPARRPVALSRRETWSERAAWLAYSAVPSSLLMGVTTYITTDLAAVPLLWVIPLALYLLTFILVFARRPPIPLPAVHHIAPLAILPLVMVMGSGVTKPLGLLLALHVVCFFVIAMACHGELARRRPSVGRLTEFYVWLSLGGVLGGLFNALIAPALFPTIVEYPLAIVLACLLRPAPEPHRPATRIEAAWNILMPMVIAVLTLTAPVLTKGWPPVWRGMLGYGVPVLICGVWANRPVRFALAVGAFLAASASTRFEWRGAIHVERSFFGVHRVIHMENYHLLMHGTTIHGVQSREPSRRCDHVAFYSAEGPLGQVFGVFEGTGRLRRVGVIGLGTGSTATYSAPGQQWTYYEIDPAVMRIAGNPEWFSYLRDCLEQGRVVLGDARLTLAHAPDGEYDLLILDAFSSDAIPTHLLTREAMELYLRKLDEGGLLALHITNRFLDLEPPVGDTAAAMGLAAMARYHVVPRPTPEAVSTRWVVVARQPEDLGPLLRDARWHVVEGRPGVRVWTDDYTNILHTLTWNSRTAARPEGR